jgi:23S rRNA pseudouridine1911/1915/1917 synthase
LTYHFDREEEQRIDKFLVECLPDLSRSRLQALIREGYVHIDGLVPSKSGVMLTRGQQVDISIPDQQPTSLVPEAVPLEIIYENDDLLVVNKPAGMVVHPSAGHSSGTLIHAVLAHAPEMEGVGGIQRPGVVHRLDKNTSGIILLAKNDPAHRWLQDQFRLRKVNKEYLALVDGIPPTPRGRIEAPIGRDPSHRQRMAVLPSGKGRDATTEYYSLRRYTKHTYLKVHPHTGRTHQIRLHLSFINCPVVGDTVYGYKHPSIPIQRHFLHAARLDIILPGKKRATAFETPLSKDLSDLLDRLN